MSTSTELQEAIERTVAAGSCHVHHSSRRDALSGKPFSVETGTADLRSLRVWLQSSAESPLPGVCSYLQVGAHFMRDASSPDYIQVPVLRMPIDQLLYASPLWLVFALRAAGDGGRRVPATAGQDDAVELELTLDPAAITRLTDPAVFVPAPRAVAFDARVWIDGGLLTRVSCWMRTRRRRLRPRELPLWITTELSDHGRAPLPEAPAVTPRSIDELI